ncbi:hypothetical protein KIW84_057256 [Lathyrus oleraceus]|uniref:Uncharacterized protein n=1 Tax=Pisum sativum TaxID=3888 RepID=A0A9D4X2N8_PEA|nr:hypothetical protein KIW84_057256 [Pisum sativum]
MAGTDDKKQQQSAEKKKAASEKKQSAAKHQPAAKQQPGGKKKEVKKETGLGLTNRKAENFGEWYSEAFFDPEIKKMKIKNCYFPVFVSSTVLEK